MPMRSWHCVLAAALASSGALPAQLRKPCFVTVVDDVGKPLAGAEVMMEWSPPVGTPGIADIVAVQTDERGRCRAGLVVGRLYHATALGPPRADGTRLVSEPVDRCASGAVLEIEAMFVSRPRTVRVEWADGLDASAFEVMHTRGPNDPRGVVLSRRADGVYNLPPSPWVASWIAMCKGGNVLQACAIEPQDQAPVVAFACPPVAHVWVRAGDGAGVVGAVATATVNWFFPHVRSPFPTIPPHLRELARSGDIGTIALPLHGVQARQPWVDWLCVSAPGFAPEYLLPEAALKSSVSSPTRVTLTRPHEARGRLRGQSADEVVFAQLHATVRKGGAMLQVPTPIEVVGDTLRVDVPRDTYSSMVVVHLWPRREGSPPRCAILPPVTGSFDALPDVDLDALRTFRVRVTAPDGSPAGSAEIVVGAVGDEVVEFATTLACDPAGRVDLRFGSGHWAVYTGNGVAHAIEFVRPDAPGGELTIVLQPIPTWRCRVVDGKGRPVHGARLERGRSATVGTARGAEAWVKAHLAAYVAWPLAERARSDRDGVLVVPVQDWRRWDVTFRVRAGQLVSELFHGKPGVDAGDVVVQ